MEVSGAMARLRSPTGTVLESSSLKLVDKLKETPPAVYTVQVYLQLRYMHVVLI